jgi:hypothetical protein
MLVSGSRSARLSVCSSGRRMFGYAVTGQRPRERLDRVYVFEPRSETRMIDRFDYVARR